ncbi:two-component sensor histidine kinase [Oculatella sp. LEGE 06141]|uniref:sensor histidine kinase n=1 Tax=Oculatella sp. LEGE 06141 TaxID=1828648 RepID=UPI0018801EEA|nr:sensor histidine kinase [Oculatella sp. LEGE 06141]MBE9176988.1 two-component sensor histidine kinase [Oculatella sp. LEGE 06141]
MPGQSSFRRILLTRILILSIPILLLGVAVTFRKARTSLLYTARQNLEESAVRKANTIQSSINALRASLTIASQASTLQSGSPEAAQVFLRQLAADLPVNQGALGDRSNGSQIDCVQLIAPQTEQPVASTCGNQAIDLDIPARWEQPSAATDANRLQMHVLTVRPGEQATPSNATQPRSQLNITLAAPVYDASGQLRYILAADATMRQWERAEARSLLGFTAIIDQNGTFLAHPFSNQVGRSIDIAGDKERFQDILDNALRGNPDVRHLFNFSGDKTEWLAGFSPVDIPITDTDNQTWVVLAVTPLDNALQGLKEITQILFILTTGLLAAHLLAMLYMARDLALPIEQLGKYARRIHKRDPLEQAPKNFRIREINQLSEVLDNMVRRLEERAKELETAWQEAEAANKLKSEILANTSHELRTPLNAIIGCIRLVKDDCCDNREEELEFLEQANRAAVHLLKIINDLLDIRRIEEEGLALAVEQVDLRQILQEVIEIQSVHIQQKGLTLTAPNLSEPIMIKADPARLKQVLLNVVYNATKFTDRGGITISTGLEPVLDSHAEPSQTSHDANTPILAKSRVVITVQDTGIGIDPAQQHKLFRPFVMVDGTTTRKFEGTGLGLAISRNLVELMGGSIGLYSDGLEKGTTVEIKLPVASVAEDAIESPKPNGAVAEVAITQSTAERSAIGT